MIEPIERRHLEVLTSGANEEPRLVRRSLPAAASDVATPEPAGSFDVGSELALAVWEGEGGALFEDSRGV